MRETDQEFEISTITEDCPNCGAPLASTLQRLTQKQQQSVPKFQIAFDLVQFKFGIKQIDNFMSLSSNGMLAITGYGANLLLTRLCVRSLLPAKHGGLGSPFAIIVDAGNKSDFYLTVDMIKQHGLHLRKTLDRIIVSRTFTIYQLRSLLQKQLPKVIEQYMPSAVIILGLLDLFEDPNIKKREAKRVIVRIMKVISELADKLLVITTLNEGNYSDFVMSSFDKRIRLTNTNRGCVSAMLYNDGRNTKIALTQKELELVRSR